MWLGWNILGLEYSERRIQINTPFYQQLVMNSSHMQGIAFH